MEASSRVAERLPDGGHRPRVVRRGAAHREYVHQLATDHLVHSWDLAVGHRWRHPARPAPGQRARRVVRRTRGDVPRGRRDRAARRLARRRCRSDLLAVDGTRLGVGCRSMPGWRRSPRRSARGDVDAIMSLMTDDCVFEATGPAPDGVRHEGADAVRAVWVEVFGNTPRRRVHRGGVVRLRRPRRAPLAVRLDRRRRRPGTSEVPTCCGSGTARSARSSPTSRADEPRRPPGCVWMDVMSSSDSIDAPDAIPDQPEHSADLDPAIAEAVDGVTNRFGAEGLEQMIAYAEKLARRRPGGARRARRLGRLDPVRRSGPAHQHGDGPPESARGRSRGRRRPPAGRPRDRVRGVPSSAPESAVVGRHGRGGGQRLARA